MCNIHNHKSPISHDAAGRNGVFAMGLDRIKNTNCKYLCSIQPVWHDINWITSVTYFSKQKCFKS